jgi:AcrR family transcriptional regulator
MMYVITIVISASRKRNGAGFDRSGFYSSGISTSLVPQRHPTAQRLLEVAIDAIDAGGESALRLDVVVEKAGVAITAVYHHFGNREGLMEAAQAERYIRTVWPLVRLTGERLAQVQDLADLKQTVLSIMGASLDPEFATNRLRRLNVVGSTLGRPRLAEAVTAEQARVNQHLAEALQPFQDQGLIRAEVDLLAFSSWVFGVILSRAIVELEPDDENARAWDQVTRQAFMALLFGDLA